MKKTIVLSFAAIVLIVSMSMDITSSNGIAGRTGSPGESVCNQAGCHSGNPLNDAAGSLTLSAPTLTGFQYVLGQTYTINVTVARPGVNLFGFDFEALISSGASAGTLTITSATTTKILNITVGGNVRKNVVHKSGGGASANTHTFSFDWTAPLTNVGNVTFYFSGNAANGNGTTSGDFIYKSSQVVTAAPLGINENNALNMSLSVFPNPASGSATISYVLDEPSKVTAKLISLTGQEVAEFYSEDQTAGKQEQRLALDPSISNGIYLISVEANGQKSFKKLIIN